MDFSEKLKKARKDKGWSQVFVSEKTSIPGSTLSGYERGYRYPDFENLKKLATLYQVSTDYLIGVNLPDITTTPPELEIDLKNALEYEKINWDGKPLSIKERKVTMDFLNTLME